MVAACTALSKNIYPSIHQERYTPFWTLATLRNLLHSSLFLLPFLFVSSILLFLGFVKFPSGRRPSVLFVVFPLAFCYGIWNSFFFHSHNMTSQSQFSNYPQNYYFIIFIALFSIYIIPITANICMFIEIQFSIILQPVYLTLRIIILLC